jgi:cellulose synthase/poly-beta-1,6-N-acetylglucosamine synthase-like glycosyltransferase
VYINDASTDGTGDYVKSYMMENQIPKQKYVLINNDKNKGNTANIYNAAHNICSLGEIMVLVDGDDSLVGRQVFSLLNAYYQTHKAAIVYTQLLFIWPDHIGHSRNRPIS